MRDRGLSHPLSRIRPVAGEQEGALMQYLDITADQARPGDVWLGNGDIRIAEIGDGPTVDYIPPGTDETIHGPLVRLVGQIITGVDRSYRGAWNVQPLQPMEVRRG